MCADVWMLETDTQSWKVLLRESNDGFVDVAEDGVFDGWVFDYLAEDAAVTATDHENVLGIRVGVQRQVGNHFLVAYE